MVVEPLEMPQVDLLQLLSFGNYHGVVPEAQRPGYGGDGPATVVSPSRSSYDPAVPPRASGPGQSDAAAVEQASLALLELTLKALSASRRLSVLQLRTLLAVDEHGPLKLADVAAMLDLSTPSASRLVTRLVEDGLMLRNTPSHDRRQVQLVVSAKGRRLLTSLRGRRQREIGGVLDAMPSDDRKALIQGLAAFAAAAAAAETLNPPLS